MALWAAALLTLPGVSLAAPDRGEPSAAPPPAFGAQMQAYFAAEKAESLLFVALGTMALVFALQAVRGGPPFARGLAGPLALVGLIQLVVGGTVFLRTEGQVQSLLQQLSHDAPGLAAAELARMAVVSRWFRVYFWIEIGLILVGLGVVAWGRTRGSRFVLGMGVALSLQSAIMLGLDLPAEARANTYVGQIRALTGDGP